MKVLVLFTCHNRKEKTIKCIESLIAGNSEKLHFIIVDDNSSDGTFEALESYENVTLIEGDGSSFYSGGMRIAISVAKKNKLYSSDYVMLINDDVIFFENIISKLIKLEEENKGVIVGATCDYTGKITYGGVIKTSRFKPSFKSVISNEKLIECDTFCANCVLIPKNIFIKTKNIDTMYRHAMGDFDYGFSMARNGVKIYASNFFVGICEDNPSNGTWLDASLSRRERLRKKETIKGLPYKQYFYYLRKNHGLTVAIVYSLIPYIKILLKK